ncbi:CYFA0S14e01574g1_1 [Cyberlindnera fabianii]|uniref:CYFA0S14e01574g1_1 n=1 Tax=Cyberlindnera fabianii TaxID=36022 RepID=A0A061B459_CYBFA|nr:CYFA0S14e01574g1_1 [Cyberlindnera fabianii]
MLVQSLLTLCVLPLTLAGFYSNSPVFELDASNFDSVVLSNQTSIIEFYAPWCGHCRNLQPEYVKVGRHLQDIAIVGAVNCDDSKNKPLCARYRIEGFPTLVVFRPPKVNLESKTHQNYAHATEIYNGPRKAKAMVEFVADRMKNYTKRFATLTKLEEWANKDTGRPKAVVLTRKDRLTTFLKSLAIDFLGKIDFGYLPLKSGKDDIFDKFEIEKDGNKSVLVVYDGDKWNKFEGDLSKDGISQYLAEFADVEEVTDRYAYLKSVIKGEKPKKKGTKGKSRKRNEKKADKKANKEHDEL